MTDTLNVNVLVAAKEEYTKQLVTTMQPGIYEMIQGIFSESQVNNKKLTISYSNFQRELKTVPSWSEYKIESKLNKINTKHPYLMDLITAIFVSHVKILACVRLKSDDKSIKIKVPKLNTFLHKILVSTCETIYYKPRIINLDKDKIFEIINTSTTDTIANQIPIQFILSEYLSGVFDEESEPEPELEPEPENDVFDTPDEEIPIVPIEPREKETDIKSFDELKDKIQKESITVNKEEGEVSEPEEDPDEEQDEEPEEEPDEEPDEEPEEEYSEDSESDEEPEVKHINRGEKPTLF